jgi:hypothetical protein
VGESFGQAVQGAARGGGPPVPATPAAAFEMWFGARSGEDIGSLLDEALATFKRELDVVCAA